ncbi:MAG TPA: 50S ribosomal protein L23 [Thermomicrobiales bacterium]|jgi:large subunit ribosomal protein L23|nr:50S ribosomal protein L23 [Thermomicrobiales bacterium]
MAELRLEDVIRRPVITEKNSWLMDKDQYTFEVHPDSTKIQIKSAVQDAFGVRVKAVNTLNVKPKAKSRMIRRGAGRISGMGRGWKKAIVTLHPGERIDIFEQF